MNDPIVIESISLIDNPEKANRVQKKILDLLNEYLDKETAKEMLLERSKVGIEKYGTTLKDNPLTESECMLMAAEEILDLLNYSVKEVDVSRGTLD